MSLAELTRKPVRTVESSCTLIEAARQMIQHSVDALVITEPSSSVPTKAPLETVSVHESLPEVTDRMHKHGVRRARSP